MSGRIAACVKTLRRRNPLIYAKDWYDANLDASQRLRYTAQVFRVEAMLQIQENDLEGSLESSRAIMHIAQATGDEPFLVSMLIRMSMRRTALRTIERTLAQGEPARRHWLHCSKPGKKKVNSPCT